MLTTPAGNPTSRISSAILSELSGVSSAGFNTTSAQLSEILYRFYESGQVASKGTLMLSLDDRILDNWKRGTRSTVKSHHALGVLWLLELSA